MTKGAVVTAVVVGGVVILGGAAIAMAYTSKPVVRPFVAPPPPPPPPQTIGGLIATAGGQLLDQLGHNDIVKTYTGGESAGSYIVKNVATGGLYGTAEGAKNVAKKVWSWL